VTGSAASQGSATATPSRAEARSVLIASSIVAVCRA
jgi:hypothetical protein